MTDRWLINADRFSSKYKEFIVMILFIMLYVRPSAEKITSNFDRKFTLPSFSLGPTRSFA